MDPESQELQPRRVCVPRDNIYRDVGVSGATGSTAGDTLAVVLIDRIGRRWPDTIRSICELRDRGGEGPLPGGRPWDERGFLRPDPHDVSVPGRDGGCGNGATGMTTIDRL